MYKLLLSSRYLRTRFIALASIVSVMLGVATMIVVNSVMSGFRHQMRERLHGLLSDIVIESTSTDGTYDPEGLEQRVLAEVGEHVEAIAPAVEIYGMLTFKLHSQFIYRPITLIGIDPERQDAVSPLKQFLQSHQPVTDGDGQTIAPPEWPTGTTLTWELSQSARDYRNVWLEHRRLIEAAYGGPAPEAPFYADDRSPPADDATQVVRGQTDPNPFAEADATQSPDLSQTRTAEGPPILPHHRPQLDVPPSELFGDSPTEVTADPSEPFPARLYVGIGLIGYPYTDEETGKTQLEMFVHPGEDVNISTIKTGTPRPAHFAATVVDVFKSGMSEFDSNLVFCNLEELQKVRGMIDPVTGAGAVTMLKIKLKDYNDATAVVKRLQANTRAFPPGEFHIYTWEQKRAPLLQAVEIESAILNVLLFLIIAVAGFGILAIFYMIVVEKTRDIGVLKALGASSRGIMSIFLMYGLSLGVVGSGVGVVLGLLFVRYINEIESVLSLITGRKVFDETIYYFHDIPTQVHPFMVFWVAFGAMAIAVLASVLPARRAARLDPVQALRYE
jgi:lipoprotein-releasing system permease protein